MIPLSAGDCLEPGVYDRMAGFSRAVYYSREDRLVCLVSEEAGAGPFYITFRGFHPARCGPCLEIRDDHFRIGGSRVERANIPVYDSLFDVEPADPAVVHSGLRLLRAKLLEAAPPESLVFLLREEARPAVTTGLPAAGFEEALRTRFFEGADALFSGDVGGGAKLLGGCGRGLTPSGDDFLAGVCYGLRLAGKLHGVDMTRVISGMLDSAEAGGPVSENFLRMAGEGRPTGHMRNVLDALYTGDTARLEPAVSHLLDFGATSGADTAAGLILTMERGTKLWSPKD